MSNKLQRNLALANGLYDKEKQYWLDKLNGELEPCFFPYDNMQGKKLEISMDFIELDFPEQLCNALNKISRGTDKNLYYVLLSGVSALLYKYTESSDFLMGMPIYKQEAEESYINTILALRSIFNDEITFKQLLVDMKTTAAEAVNNQNYPLDLVLEELGQGDINNAIQTAVLMENIQRLEYVKDIGINIIFSFCKTEADIKCKLYYNTMLYKQESIKYLGEHLIMLMQNAMMNIDCKICELEMISDIERHKIMQEFNSTYADYLQDKTLHQMFEEQAARTPDNIALLCEDKSLTYKELNQRANQLARKLSEKGVQPDNIIALLLERSLEMIVGILGVLKAGAAYLPIDPEYPADRIQYMLEDSKADVVLTQSWLNHDTIGERDIFELDKEDIFEGDSTNLGCLNSPSNLAYIIYTSGSTGRPKGVMLEHKSVVNYLQWVYDSYKHIGALDFAIFTSLSFDLTVTSVFTPLLFGYKGVIYREADAARVIKEGRANIAKLTPSHLELIKENDNTNSNIKCFIVGGEQLKVKLAKRVTESFGGKIEIYNEYGPTEATVGCMIYKYDTEKDVDNSVPIGVPAANTQIYIVDKYNKICPVGAAGELCIAGHGLARGYINRADLTAQKFVDNVFEKSCSETSKMYRTGDLARLLPNGNIEFLRRIDHQVKIRGFRIELEEIENKISGYEGIKEAVVIAKEDEGDNKYLCAYITVNEQRLGQNKLTAAELREYLSQHLPDYMIPSYFMQLDKMPLTTNGKVDRKALADNKNSQYDTRLNTGAAYEAPRNEIEEKLTEMWKEILKLDNIGINDNFFELGGHSLKATSLIARIHKEFNTEVLLKEVFDNPTIKELGSCIKASEQSSYAEIQTAEAVAHEEGRSIYYASSAQNRIHTLQQFDADSISYNMPVVLHMEGQLNKKKLEKAFARLIERHEALRTGFEHREEGLVQILYKNLEFEVEYVEARGDEIDLVISKFIRAFDLSRAPLLRAALIKLPDKQDADENPMILPKQQHCSSERHMLLLDLHHIISDGVSMSILTKEFAACYEDKELPGLRIQYKDYAAWQHQQREAERIRQQEQYWLEQYKDEIPVLNMPTDYPRPAIQSFEGNKIDFELNEELTKGLKQLVKETESTLYMVMLAVLNILISKYSRQEDIIIGSPIAGRPHADLQNIMGMFVNTLAMRNHPDAQKTIRQFIREVKENALKAYENQDYQFEDLVERLSLTRDLSRNPLFDIMFVMQNTDNSELRLEDLTIKPYKADSKIAKFDITFMAAELEDKISLNIEYCTRLYKKETIQRMYTHLENLIRSTIKEIAEGKDPKLSDIEIISENEIRQILTQFNSTDTEYPRHKTVHQLFEEQVQKTPSKTAIVHESKNITYQELNKKANQLARKLRSKEAKKDQLIGIMTDKSIEMVIGILAILKAGSAYLPVDPDYPQDRIRYMLKDSKAHILLTQAHLNKAIDFDGEVLLLDDEQPYTDEADNLEEINAPDDLAYVIYTSGSTGKPKGSMIEHKSIVRLVKNTNYIEFNEDDRILQTGAIVFDAITFELWGALLNGLSLYLVNKEKIIDADKLKEEIESNKITTIWVTASLFNQIIDENPSVFDSCKNLLVGGDVVSPKHVNQVRSTNSSIRIINGYGPTENTTFTTCYTIKEECKGSIPIGKPIANTKVYVLDKYNKLMPIGVPGELCTSGDGVARGYLNNAELTEQVFVPNPLNRQQIMYRTGDLVRWLPDGNIEFLGRIDNQVKIRGYRIELGEIESKLLNNENVKDAVVTVRQSKDNSKYLCAYIVLDADREGEAQAAIRDIREYMAKELPDYMIPQYFVRLDKLPLTPNGKADRRALPEPEADITMGIEYEAPSNALESKLAELWMEVLAVDSVGINHSFFEIGGDSLKAVKLITRIKKELKAEISLREIYVSKTIKELAKIIDINQLGIVPEDEGIILIKKGISRNRHVFLIHPASGEISAYNKLCTDLDDRYNYWGIRSNILDDIIPVDTTMEQIAKAYAERIKQVQPKGPYYLAGWCIGGHIAFEMASQLESEGEEVRFVSFINSLAPNNVIEAAVNKKLTELSADNEIKYLNKTFMKNTSFKPTHKELKAIWEEVVERLKDKELDYKMLVAQTGVHEKQIPYYENLELTKFIYYINLIRTIIRVSSIYKPSKQIRAKGCYFIASESRRKKIDNWNKYFDNISFTEVRGDHYSIMETDAAAELAAEFNKCLDKYY